MEIFKKQKKIANIVITGHVDSGKSTLTGHLLKKLGLVTKKQLRKIKKQAVLNKKESFTLAYLLDEDETA